MSKAVLVLDEMPTCCRECPLYIGGMYGKGITKSFVTMCGANHSENFEDVTRYRLHSCPLKEAPEPKVDHLYCDCDCKSACAEKRDSYNQALHDCGVI